jgi:hypothetical protein
MISCHLQGGLGNQMFQIAATVSLAIDNSDQACFNFSNCETRLQGKPSYFYENNIFKKICNNKNISFLSYYSEPKFSFTEIIYTSNMQLFGYFQSEKYFINNKKTIKNLFDLEIEKVSKPSNNVTSVHIRRGDYIRLDQYHRVLGIEYYKKAIETIGTGDFLFFSDDMSWVKENFIGNNFYYSHYNDDLLDLSLMSICDNHIIANSSFSWWGAYLNKNENKKVIAPSDWFGPIGPKDTQDLLPENWIKI